MTSSQALNINIFGPLFHAADWTASTLSNVLGISVMGAGTGSIEFTPVVVDPHLKDKTLADAYVELYTAAGAVGVVIETKYADRFSSRYLDVAQNPRYVAFNKKFEIWQTDSNYFGIPSTDQLARLHALGTVAAKSPAFMIVLHYPGDVSAIRIANEYRQTLVDAKAFVLVDLREFLSVMGEAAVTEEQRAIAQRLVHRYLSLELSEPYWALQER